MLKRLLENKKKLLALLLAAILAIAGLRVSPELQDTIVNTISGVLPDAPAEDAAAPAAGVTLKPAP